MPENLQNTIRNSVFHPATTGWSRDLLQSCDLSFKDKGTVLSNGSMIMKPLGDRDERSVGVGAQKWRHKESDAETC